MLGAMRLDKIVLAAVAIASTCSCQKYSTAPAPPTHDITNSALPDGSNGASTDDSPVQVTSNQDRLTYDEGQLHVSFPSTLTNGRMIQAQVGALSMKARLTQILVGDRPIGPLGEPLAQVFANGLIYRAIVPGIDLAIEVGNLAVSQQFILDALPSADGHTGDVFFTELLVPEGLALSYRVDEEEIVEGTHDTSNPIDIVDAATHRTLLRIRAPYMWDSNPNRYLPVRTAHRITIGQDKSVSYSVFVPGDYLADPSRIYPITVDPDWEVPCGDTWCDDGDPCTYDSCQGDVANGWSCDHDIGDSIGRSCWGGWTCTSDHPREDTAHDHWSGGCDTVRPFGCTNDDSCERGNPCETFSCRKSSTAPRGGLTGECIYEAANGGAACWGSWGTCSAGQCTYVPARQCRSSVDCVDGNPCTDDLCRDGSCEHAVPALDGTRCAGGEAICIEGVCRFPECHVDADCETDGNPCTVDSCVSAGLSHGGLGCSRTVAPDGTPVDRYVSSDGTTIDLTICQDAEVVGRCWRSNCQQNQGTQNDEVIPGGDPGCFVSECVSLDRHAPTTSDGDFGYCDVVRVLEGKPCAGGGRCDAAGSCVLAYNQCSIENGGCDPRVSCSDLPDEPPLCGPCPSGFSGSGATGCTDIDECSASPNPCVVGQECVNTPGSFVCDSHDEETLDLTGPALVEIDRSGVEVSVMLSWPNLSYSVHARTSITTLGVAEADFEDTYGSSLQVQMDPQGGGAYVVLDDTVIDGVGVISDDEGVKLDVLGSTTFGYGMARLPMELACQSNSYISPEEAAVLIFPWQLMLKYLSRAPSVPQILAQAN